MLLKSKQTIGGIHSMQGNEIQLRYAIYHFFKNKDYIFFHQHISEDIETHYSDGVILVQVKKNQVIPSDVAKYLEKYFYNEDFVNFVVENRDLIKEWLWVTDSGKHIRKNKIFELINILEIHDKRKKTITGFGNNEDELKKISAFLEVVKKRFKFVNATWLETRDTTFEKTKTHIPKTLGSKRIKERYFLEAKEMLIEQNEILIEKTKQGDIEFNNFKDLRNLFTGYSRDELLLRVRRKKGKTYKSNKNIAKLTSVYGPLKARMYILDYNKKYAISRAGDVGISKSELMEMNSDVMKRR